MSSPAPIAQEISSLLRHLGVETPLSGAGTLIARSPIDGYSSHSCHGSSRMPCSRAHGTASAAALDTYGGNDHNRGR